MVSDIFRTFAAVNQNIMDISEVLQTTIVEMRSIREKIASQQAVIYQQNRTIDKLNADVHKLNKLIEELKTRLSKYEMPGKNSGNSSTPPSKENVKAEVVRRTKTLGKQTGKKPGGQLGHEGNTLKMTETPDEKENVQADYCTKCGSPLDDCERILDYVTQVVSIPALRPIVKEIRHYITVCKKNVESAYRRMRHVSAVPMPWYMTQRSKAWLCYGLHWFSLAFQTLSARLSACP